MKKNQLLLTLIYVMRITEISYAQVQRDWVQTFLTLGADNVVGIELYKSEQNQFLKRRA